MGYFIGWSNLELNHFDQYINGLNDVKELFIKRGNLEIAADLSVFVNNSAQLFVWIWQGNNNTYEHDTYNDGIRSIEWNYYVLINLKH